MMVKKAMLLAKNKDKSMAFGKKKHPYSTYKGRDEILHVHMWTENILENVRSLRKIF